MTPERREALRRTYLSLGLGELASALVFTGLALSVRLPDADRRPLAIAVAPLVFVLVQAGCYWLAARSWVGVDAMPRPLAVAYRGCAVINPLLLLIALGGVVRWLPDGAVSRAIVLGAWIFGAVEHVNYYVVRLAYPARQWARLVRQRRTPQLRRDLAAARLNPRG